MLQRVQCSSGHFIPAQNTHGSGVDVPNSGSYFIQSFIHSFKVIMSLHGQEQSLERDSKRLNPCYCACACTRLIPAQNRKKAKRS